jgi:CPA2 family monovalent cation:H+ antiporter-2
MPHDVSLISTIAVGFGLALVLGFVAARLRMPPLVGYLIAGVLIGPGTPGFVADVKLAAQLAEIGVMLLMFGVGLHFSVADLVAVRRIAIPGAIVQIAVAVAMGAGLSIGWGWSLGAALVFGLCLSVASTVVLIKALESRGLLDTANGRIAVGWLVVEDLVMVIVLVLLPVFAGLMASAASDSEARSPQDIALAAGWTLTKVLAFVASMLVIGRRVFPRMLWWVASTGSRELFTLCVVAAAVGVAFGAAKLFDVSFALGAFFAGMMMRESEFAHRAADESLPLRDAFAVLFFVSVGMLFDPAVLWQSPLKLLATVAIIVLGKTLAAVALVLLFRYPLSTALTVGLSLAQIGEFSFILAGLGTGLGLLPKEGQDLVLAAALLSIAANSALFGLSGPLNEWLQTRSALARRLALRDDPLAQLPSHVDMSRVKDLVVLVGHDAVGRQVAQRLREQGLSLVVADERREVVEALRAQHIPAVAGDLTDPATLIQAHIAKATALLINQPDSLRTRQMVEVARELNPGVHVVALAGSEEEADLLSQEMGIRTCLPEAALARALGDQVIEQLKAPTADRTH